MEWLQALNRNMEQEEGSVLQDLDARSAVLDAGQHKEDTTAAYLENEPQNSANSRPEHLLGSGVQTIYDTLHTEAQQRPLRQQDEQDDIPQPGGGSTASSPISPHISRQKQPWHCTTKSPGLEAGQDDMASGSSSPAASPTAGPSSRAAHNLDGAQPSPVPQTARVDSDMPLSVKQEQLTVSTSSSPMGANALQSPSSVFLPAPSVANSLQFQAAGAAGASPSSQSNSAVSAALAASFPAARPTYSALQLRCQALEVALEQQTQRTEAAQASLATAHAQHASEEASIRQYYEAQLSDRQHELNLLMQHMAAAAARAESAAAADGGGSTVIIGVEESMGFTSVEVHPSPLGPQQQQQHAATVAAAGRPLSPTVAAVAAGAGMGALAGSIVSSSVSLTDVALLRRELAQAEGLIKAYQVENKAAAKRIKELESQLSSAKRELADEAGRAQRAAAAAAELQRTSGAAAAERLQRQLQLEGQIGEMQSAWQEREEQLLAQVESLRRDRAAAAAQAAAAAEGHDMVQWQLEDALVAELRAQLADQAAAHAAQLQSLQDKLNWYAENQVLLGSADQLVAQQAELIRQLELRLMEAEGAAGRTQAARIAELEEQVVALQEALASRHPSSLPALLAAAKPGPGEAAALAQAAATIRQLESQLEQQQQMHEHGVRQLQQQYEALKARLEQQNAVQQAAAGGPKHRVRELTQQLEEQRSMYTRRIRTLEAKLTAAEGAAAASRRASSSSAGGSAGGHTAKSAAAAAGLRRSKQVAATSTAAAAATDECTDGDKQLAASAAAADEKAARTFSDSNGQQEGVASIGAVAGGGGAVVSGLLRVKERQMAGLVAQLEERTSQFLQLQQKYRAAQKQLKALTAKQQQQAEGDSRSPAAAARTRSQGRTAAAVAAAGAASEGDGSDTAFVPDALPCSDSAGQRALGPMVSPQRRKRGSTSGGATTASTTTAASWPALCAELESENEQLKVALAEARSAVEASQQQITSLTAQLGDMHQARNIQPSDWVPGISSVGQAGLPPAQYLLSVVEESAVREAARWEAQVTALQQMLHSSQSEAASLAQELAMCKAQGGTYTPSVAAFDALERKINALEAAAALQQQKQLLQQHQQQLTQGLLAGLGLDPAVASATVGSGGNSLAVVGEVVAAITQKYEAALATKNAELEGFRVQLDALLKAAHQLQEKQAAVPMPSL